VPVDFLPALLDALVCDSEALPTAVNAATKRGLVTGAAAGNEGAIGTILSPACASTAVAVDAVYSADIGKKAYKDDNSGLDCVDNTTRKDLPACFANRCGKLHSAGSVLHMMLPQR
jgi:hypothetical protein